MTETRTIILGARDFTVPALPLRFNMKAYPLCRKLTNAGLIDRAMEAKGVLDVTEAEMADLVELAFLGVSASESAISRADFEALPVTPPELLDAFFLLRYQTGGWTPVAASGEGPDTGEAEGAAKPPK